MVLPSGGSLGKRVIATAAGERYGCRMYRAGIGALAAVSLGISGPATASERDWDLASDVGRNALVVAALGLPAVQGDWRGTKQAALSMGSARLATGSLKYAIDAERPDGSNNNSFPSGHTSTSFAAAATLGKRHGWEYGVPARAVALFVGVARVKAKKHYVRDVIAGAAIGEAAGWLLTTPKNSNVRWLPWADTKGAGAHVSVQF